MGSRGKGIRGCPKPISMQVEPHAAAGLSDTHAIGTPEKWVRRLETLYDSVKTFQQDTTGALPDQLLGWKTPIFPNVPCLWAAI